MSLSEKVNQESKKVIEEIRINQITQFCFNVPDLILPIHKIPHRWRIFVRAEWIPEDEPVRGWSEFWLVTLETILKHTNFTIKNVNYLRGDSVYGGWESAPTTMCFKELAMHVNLSRI